MAEGRKWEDCAGAEEGQALGISRIGFIPVDGCEEQSAPAPAPGIAAAIALSSRNRR